LNQHPRFVSLYWQMQESFRDRKYGKKVATHEAAHAVLMEQDNIPNVRFAGPDIRFNGVDFSGTCGRALGDDMPDAVVDDDFILMIASHAAAGGEALRNADIKDEVGDSGDYDDFARRYAVNPAKSGEDAKTFWEKARKAAATRLTEPETQEKVSAKADEYYRLLYPNG
jgi:hypothetical protein